MFNRLLLFLQIIFIAGLISCKAYRPVISKSVTGGSTDDYISKYRDLAISEMKRTGIPASITLAQGMIESDYGRSRLAREANNHFGIKCHNDWTGPTIRHNDDRRNECFRKYGKPEDSYYDHSDFLKSGSRYKSLFYLNPTDYKGWARGLKKAGYATNPDYANMLIRKIEEYNLSDFDRNIKGSSLQPPYTVEGRDNDSVQNPDNRPVPVNSSEEKITLPSNVQRVMENNRIQFIIVKDGDTREKLEDELHLLRWELPRYNELDSDFPLVTGQILYLQPKRDKAEPGKEYHTTVEGDTMYGISQQYGIKLKSLYEMNRMSKGEEPKAGDKIWLRGIKKAR